MCASQFGENFPAALGEKNQLFLFLSQYVYNQVRCYQTGGVHYVGHAGKIIKDARAQYAEFLSWHTTKARLPCYNYPQPLSLPPSLHPATLRAPPCPFLLKCMHAL